MTLRFSISLIPIMAGPSGVSGVSNEDMAFARFPIFFQYLSEFHILAPSGENSRSYVPLEFYCVKQVFKIIESDSGHEILPR